MKILTEELQKISQELINKGFIDNSPPQFVSISGGSVNCTYGLISKQKRFFIKINKRKEFPQMFEKEAKGLGLLTQVNAIKIPNVIHIGNLENTAFLVLELIETGEPNKKFWENLALGLGNIHAQTTENFGLDYSNYNGSLPQINSWKSNWPDFFIENRLSFQLKLAVDAKKVDGDFMKLMERAMRNIKGILPNDKPALLHGDLWSGNFLSDHHGKPVLIDPAVYYGHREVDIAMSLLFGGFQKKFYEVYNQHFPLQHGWEKRVDLFNLYPLMVHVNLFGPSYAQRVKSILKRFV